MPDGELLVRWAVRLALIGYLWVLGHRLYLGRPAWQRASLRVVWVLGCLAFLAHVGFAFHFVHHWSHRAAFDETAKRTEEVLGVRVGVGLFVNHGFALTWVLDAGYWLLRPGQYAQQSTWRERIVHGFMLFIALNGAIVFAQERLLQIVSSVCLLGLGACWWLGRPRLFKSRS